MLMDTASHQFLEYGTHENAMYGTKLDTIRDVINNGYIAVLDVEPPVCRLSCNLGYFVVCSFISYSVVIYKDTRSRLNFPRKAKIET